MNIFDGVKNFMNLINENWTSIIVIIGLCVAIGKKIENYIKLTDDEKIELAKKQIQEYMLKLVSDAEENYETWEQAGSIKRSEVITRIFKEYPILSKVADQDELIKWIDEQIDAALPTLRELWEKKEEKEKIVTDEQM